MVRCTLGSLKCSEKEGDQERLKTLIVIMQGSSEAQGPTAAHQQPGSLPLDAFSSLLITKSCSALLGEEAAGD